MLCMYESGKQSCDMCWRLDKLSYACVCLYLIPVCVTCECIVAVNLIGHCVFWLVCVCVSGQDQAGFQRLYVRTNKFGFNNVWHVGYKDPNTHTHVRFLHSWAWHTYIMRSAVSCLKVVALAITSEVCTHTLSHTHAWLKNGNNFFFLKGTDYAFSFYVKCFRFLCK